MDTKQWNTLINESMAAYEMSGIIQRADDWFKQGFEYWKACGEIASSYAAPQTWLETAGGVSKTMEIYLKGWAGGYGWGRNTALEEDLAAQKQQAIKAEAALQKIKKEKATFKRTLTLKEKTLKAKGTELDTHKKNLHQKKKEIQTLKRTLTLREKTLKTQGAELEQNQKRLREKEKEIQTLQAKVKVQGERLNKLEAAGQKGANPAAPSKSVAAVMKSG